MVILVFSLSLRLLRIEPDVDVVYYINEVQFERLLAWKQSCRISGYPTSFHFSTWKGFSVDCLFDSHLVIEMMNLSLIPLDIIFLKNQIPFGFDLQLSRDFHQARFNIMILSYLRPSFWCDKATFRIHYYTFWQNISGSFQLYQVIFEK